MQKINLGKFVKRAAFITLILASVEVLVFIFLSTEKKQNLLNYSKHKNSKEHLALPSSPEIHKTIMQDTTKIITPVIPKLAEEGQEIIDSTNTRVNIYLNDSNSTNKLSTENARAQKELQKLFPIYLSDEKMLQIIKRIGVEKKRTNNTLNCVQIRKTINSNVKNAFMIAELLKARGYIISGRIVIPANQKGMKITSHSGCIQLTIGHL